MRKRCLLDRGGVGADLHLGGQVVHKQGVEAELGKVGGGRGCVGGVVCFALEGQEGCVGIFDDSVCGEERTNDTAAGRFGV